MKDLQDITRHLEQVAPLIPLPLCWRDGAGDLAGANSLWQQLSGEPQAEDRHAIISAPLHAVDGNLIGSICCAVPRHAQSGSSDDHHAFVDMVQKIAHDIQSPLTALSIMINVCDELNESKRLILKNAFNAIKDIANNILTKYGQKDPCCTGQEPVAPVLCSDFVLKSISERKIQHQTRPVKFDVDIAPAAQFAFIHVQPSQLHRAINNLINNAVDASQARADGRVAVSLDVSAQSVRISIADNGVGMSPDNLQKIRSRTRFTDGKQNGHGLGMMQVWDMVEQNAGDLQVASTLQVGTRFDLTFPLQEQAGWIIAELVFNCDDIVLILDDDQLIHDAWNIRLAAVKGQANDLVVYHEKNGDAALRYIESLSEDDRRRVLFLCDYELLNQSLDGLQIIERCHLDRVVLVTSYFNDPSLQQHASRIGIKILPKQLASVVPICCNGRSGHYRVSQSDVMYDKNYYALEQPQHHYLSFG